MKTAQQEFVYVTGNLNVSTPERAEQVMKAFKDADKGHSLTTVYVLGSLFGPGVHEDAMMKFMQELPGRKTLIYDPYDPSTEVERKLKFWFAAETCATLELWGKTFHLCPHIGSPYDSMIPPGGLIVHADKEDQQDSGEFVNAAWDHWSDQFGPGGLQNLYALSILADQIGAGVACPETREPL